MSVQSGTRQFPNTGEKGMNIMRKKDCVEALMARQPYRYWNDGCWQINFNAKIHNFSPFEDAKGWGAFDNSWREFCEDRESEIWEFAIYNLADYFTKAYPANFERYGVELNLHGRMNGHLCMEKWDGYDLRNVINEDFEEFLRHTHHTKVLALYDIVCELDDLTDEANLARMFDNEVENFRREWEYWMIDNHAKYLECV